MGRGEVLPPHISCLPFRRSGRIIDIRTDEVDFARAKRNVEDTLTTYPDIDGLVGLWSYNTPQIVEAVRASRR